MEKWHGGQCGADLLTETPAPKLLSTWSGAATTPPLWSLWRKSRYIWSKHLWRRAWEAGKKGASFIGCCGLWGSRDKHWRSNRRNFQVSVSISETNLSVYHCYKCRSSSSNPGSTEGWSNKSFKVEYSRYSYPPVKFLPCVNHKLPSTDEIMHGRLKIYQKLCYKVWPHNKNTKQSVHNFFLLIWNHRPSGPMLSISRNVHMCVCLCVSSLLTAV